MTNKQAPKSKKPHQSQKPLNEQVAEDKAMLTTKIGTHAYYERRRRELNPEKFANLIVLKGPLYEPRTKGRSHRGWTEATK
jgi:hypothetical protein